MRIYGNAYELMSEVFREVFEMGHIVHPYSMQNKKVGGDDNYSTKEITNYSYCLTSIKKYKYLFFAEEKALEWARTEFNERINPELTNPGKAWEIRPDVWKEFLNKEGRFDYTYNERMIDQLEIIMEELKNNPDTRQAVLSIWNPDLDLSGIGGEYRVPCSMYYQFLLRDGKLNIVYNQRSADVVTHFGNDVFLAWSLMEYIADMIDAKPGYLFHNIGSFHSYKKDWDKLKRCIEEIQIV